MSNEWRILAILLIPLVFVACNEPPEFLPKPPQSVSVTHGTQFAVEFDVIDPDGDHVTVTAIGLPPGLVLEERWVASTVAGSGPAGTGTGGYADGPALSAVFDRPRAIVVTKTGDILVGDAVSRIRKISISGDVTTIAGFVAPGYQDGLVSNARFRGINGITIARGGDIFVGESSPLGRWVRRIDGNGEVTTIAGGVQKKGNVWYPDGPGLDAGFSHIADIASQSNGDIFVISCNGNTLRKINNSNEVVSVHGRQISGGFDFPVHKYNCPMGMGVGPNGSVYIADTSNKRLVRVDTAGQISVVADKFTPFDVVYSATGELFVVSGDPVRLSRVETNGTLTKLVGGKTTGYADGEGENAQFANWVGNLSADKNGKLYLADRGNHRIRGIERIGYRIGGKYNGDPCGGTFHALLRANDGRGKTTNTTVTIKVPETPLCVKPVISIDDPQEKDDEKPAPLNVAEPADIVPTEEIELAIKKTGVGQVVSGDDVQFEIDVENRGPGVVNASSKLIVKDLLPGGLTLPITAVGGSSWACANNLAELICDYVGPEIAAGNSLPVLKIQAKSEKPGTYNNCAEVSSGGQDNNISNNKSCAPFEVVPAGPCDLYLENSTSTPSVKKGDPISYKITVTNKGGQPCETARFINYWASSIPLSVLWTENTPSMLAASPAEASTWSYSSSGFPVGDPLLGGPGVPDGDLYRQPNKPFYPNDPPLVFSASKVGSAIAGAINCTIGVVSIQNYHAARLELSAIAVTSKPSGLGSASGNDKWADKINTKLRQKGIENVACVGINVF